MTQELFLSCRSWAIFVSQRRFGVSEFQSALSSRAEYTLKCRGLLSVLAKKRLRGTADFAVLSPVSIAIVLVAAQVGVSQEFL